MAESQNIEWKQNWHDDYLKWICGFANAQGGKMYIGMNDQGQVKHLAEYKPLMDILPQKVKDHMGILPEINLGDEQGAKFIEIIVQPSMVAVSLRGRYYFRSGSTNRELTGNALNEFLLRKSGRTWDDVFEKGFSIKDIDTERLAHFVSEAESSGRLPDCSGLSDREILEKLRLLDGNKFKRAAIILFGKDPNIFFSNISVRIGRFGEDDTDLEFQEIEEGNLVHLLKSVPAQLNNKFFARKVDFEGLRRVERGEYPVAAIREMLLNALVHRSYLGAAVQIRVYHHKVSIWNEGQLPDGMDIDSLRVFHVSRPRNPLIADICFKGGYIDSWGRGTLKIYSACHEAGLPEPEIVEKDGGILVTIYKDKYPLEQLKKLGLSERQMKAVEFVKKNGRINNTEYQSLNSISKATATRDLMGLVEHFGILVKTGQRGVGIEYVLK